MISARENKKLFYLSMKSTLQDKSTGVVIATAVEILEKAFKVAKECIELRKTASWEDS